MPKCAWILTGALFFLLSHTIGTAATVAIPFQLAAWVIHTPAALVIVASLAAYHLLNFHTPRPRRTAHTHH
jgi:uncharacterized integral membrane protein